MAIVCRAADKFLSVLLLAVLPAQMLPSKVAVCAFCLTLFISSVVPESQTPTLLASLQNLIRGRGAFCRSMMKSQLASPTFTPTYAALVAIINTKFPEIGELLLKRVISQVNLRLAYIPLAHRKHKCFCTTDLYHDH